MSKSLLHRAAQLTLHGDARHRQKVIREFARQFHLLYFASTAAGLLHADAVRGSTSAHGQIDRHICIGEHDGYEVILLERHVTFESAAAPASTHDWLILQIDLQTSRPRPFVFVGTRQQSKVFYARLFTARREVRLLDPRDYIATDKFDTQFTLVASPAEQIAVAEFLSQPITDTMLQHKLPFAIEIFDDRLLVITDAARVSRTSLTRMLHYGLWLARHLDQI